MRPLPPRLSSGPEYAGTLRLRPTSTRGSWSARESGDVADVARRRRRRRTARRLPSSAARAYYSPRSRGGAEVQKMKSACPRACAAVGLIVSLVAGCDNVSWGGADIAVVPPPPKARTTTPTATVEARVEPLPTKPILYYVARNRSGAFMTPVGEIQGDTLSPIRATGDR